MASDRLSQIEPDGNLPFMEGTLKTFIAVSFAFFLTVTTCDAAGIILQWDAIQKTGLRGYRIYYKSGSSSPPYNGTTSFQGKSPVQVKINDLYDPKNPEYTLFGLKTNETHFMRVTAYTDKAESEYSNLLIFTPDDADFPSFAPIRINAGGKTYVDQNGKEWLKDYGYAGGGKSRTRHVISNVEDGEIFKTERSGKKIAYRFDVPSGRYMVNCYFSEIKKKFSRVGKRVFSVIMEGDTVSRDLDIYDHVGHDKALVKSFKVTVEDEQLNINFVRSSGRAKISAIEIYKIN